MHLAQRLTVRAVDCRLAGLGINWSTAALRRHGRRITEMWVSGVRRDKRLRLGRDRCEDTFLLKALAIGAATILGCFEARAPNLEHRCQHTRGSHDFLMINSLCASYSSGKRSLYAASVPVGYNSCAVKDHRADLVDALGTCRRQEGDTCLDAADAAVEVRSPFLPKMRWTNVVGRLADWAVP